MGIAGKGWMGVPGIRPNGDRTFEQQFRGVGPAVSMAAGKSVLDLGCAEGLIGREFARSGASEVVGIELLEDHLLVAAEACKGIKNIRFIRAHLAEWALSHPDPEQYDIVLALSIIHKIKDPAAALTWALKSCKETILLRPPIWSTGGIIGSKHSAETANVPAIMAAQGFRQGIVVDAALGEHIEYWHRA